MKSKLFILAAVVLLAVSTACTTPPVTPDFSTPEKTLKTFHSAFRNDIADLEYECLSRDFKNKNEILYQGYYDFREEFKANNRILSFLAGLVDIEGCVRKQEIHENGRIAVLSLDLMGEEVSIAFIRENKYRLEFDEGRPEADIIGPMEHVISTGGSGMFVTLPLSPKTRKRLDKIRRIEVKEQWKFYDFSYLSEKTAD